MSSFSRPFLTLLTDSSPASAAEETAESPWSEIASSADEWRLDALCAEISATSERAFGPWT